MILILALTAWCWQGLWQENLALTKLRSERRGQASRPLTRIGAGSPPTASPLQADQARLAVLQNDIASVRQQLAGLKREADAVAARLPATQADEIITSLGKIDDMGREAGGVLKELVAFVAHLKPGESVDAEDESIPLRLMQLQGELPEIRSFESHPDEIATFQSNALRQALDLSPEATAKTQDLISAAFSNLATQHLTANDRPAEDDASWKQQRTSALQSLMSQLRPLLPVNGTTNREKLSLMFVLNLGAGFDQDVGSQPGKEKPVVRMAWGMNWPVVPW